MSGDDLDIWEQVLERGFSAADTSAEIIDIIDNIISKCPAIGSRYVGGAVPLRIDMDLA
jgi:hypothetical protein